MDAVDDRVKNGQFILSGSAMPDDGALRHSGAGRFRRVVMCTMTFFETGESSGDVSLEALLREVVDVVESPTTFEEVLHRMVVGGWPDSLLNPLLTLR